MRLCVIEAFKRRFFCEKRVTERLKRTFQRINTSFFLYF